MNNEQIAKTIKEILKSKGITQKKMLEDCGFGINYLSQIASGSETSLIKLEKIANYLDVDLNDILYGGGERFVFYDRLLEACEINSIKLTPLLKELSMSPGSIARWKNGVLPNVKTAQLLAERLNVTVGWLMGEEDAVAPEELKALYDKIDMLGEESTKKLNEYLDFLLSRQNQK